MFHKIIRLWLVAITLTFHSAKSASRFPEVRDLLGNTLTSLKSTISTDIEVLRQFIVEAKITKTEGGALRKAIKDFEVQGNAEIDALTELQSQLNDRVTFPDDKVKTAKLFLSIAENVSQAAVAAVYSKTVLPVFKGDHFPGLARDRAKLFRDMVARLTMSATLIHRVISDIPVSSIREFSSSFQASIIRQRAAERERQERLMQEKLAAEETARKQKEAEAALALQKQREEAAARAIQAKKEAGIARSAERKALREAQRREQEARLRGMVTGNNVEAPIAEASSVIEQVGPVEEAVGLVTDFVAEGKVIEEETEQDQAEVQSDDADGEPAPIAEISSVMEQVVPVEEAVGLVTGIVAEANLIAEDTEQEQSEVQSDDADDEVRTPSKDIEIGKTRLDELNEWIILADPNAVVETADGFMIPYADELASESVATESEIPASRPESEDEQSKDHE